MKASDFTTTNSERERELESLVRTETTDAVNSGLVGKADKSTHALKDSVYGASKKSSQAAKQAVHAVRAATEGSEKKQAASETTASTQRSAKGKSGRKKGASSPSQTQGEDFLDPLSLQKEHHLGERLKKTAKGMGVSTAVSQTLKDSELEGADDVAYGAKSTYQVGKQVGKRLHLGKDALEKKGSLGGLSEKKYQSQAETTAQAQSQAQSTRYFKQTVYETAKDEAAKKGGELALAGGKGGLLSSGIFSFPVFAIIVAVILAFVVFSAALSGLAEEEDQQKNASMDGMPSWVTYDLVLACLNAHEQYGYPAGALLGQMMIENGTDDEGSELGRLYHNYGGIKYAGNSYGGLITGKIGYWTTEYSPSGTPYQAYAYFAVFADDAAYMTYRCEHLYKQGNYTRVPNYQKAIDENNSELFLRALGEGGYYTASQDEYVGQYRSLCERYPLLAALDSMTAEEFESAYSGGASYPGGGEDYQSAEAWQKAIVNACAVTPWPGADYCATWTSRVYARCGYTVHGNGNSQLGNQGYGANYYPSRATTDLSQVKVGMLLSAQYGANNPAGNTYGHVGIYVGDGMVMESISSGVRTIPLSEWVEQNNRGWVVCGYPWDWR